MKKKIFEKASIANELYKYGTMKNASIHKTEEEALEELQRIQDHNRREANFCYANPLRKPNFIRRTVGCLRTDIKDVVAK